MRLPTQFRYRSVPPAPGLELCSHPTHSFPIPNPVAPVYTLIQKRIPDRGSKDNT
jgi:hypothetical protein